MKLQQVLFTIAITAALCSCASMDEPQQVTTVQPAKPAMSKAQCRKIKSYKQGMLDGRSGKSRTEFESLAESCRAHKVKLQHKQYVLGWDHGIKSYCQTKKVFKLGKEGQAFPEACKNQRSAERAYGKGKKASEKRASHTEEHTVAINTDAPAPNKTQLAELETQLQEISDNKAQIQNDLDFFRDGLVHKQREMQLKDLSEREHNLRAQIKSMKHANA